MDKDNEILQQSINDRIDAFVRGMMTEEEEAAFKQEIKADPELRAQVLATVSLIKGIRTQNAEKEKDLIDNNERIVVEASQQSSDQVPPSRIRSIMLWACSIAALFAIFFGVYKEKRYRDLTAIVSPYYSEYSMADYSRGDLDSTTVTNLYTIFNNIQTQRNVGDLIIKLEPMYSSPRYYGLYAHIFANDIAFNLAIAYIKDDQISKAIPVLEKLERDNPDTPIAAKAQDILIKLIEK